ncbi:hypothetical protein GOP47_0023416 [Adiantum capillus-veneris]|uniref:Uncharacterized protein n=1 Tax=Adiantum capillus-veneris TaxID=13818 RepID=A0A9D4Z5W1_ADICA|nr:hypothetical protein GOP47_0023416 [Adiantum capillus-veneris]
MPLEFNVPLFTIAKLYGKLCVKNKNSLDDDGDANQKYDGILGFATTEGSEGDVGEASVGEGSMRAGEVKKW